MKKLGIMLVAAVMVATSAAYVSAGTKKASKPEKGIVVGQAIELSTYAMKDSGDEGYIDALKSRTDQGFPVAILEEDTGDVWIVVYRNPAPASGMETGNEMMAPLMGMKVVAQGIKYRAPGVNLIRMSIVSEY